MIFKTNLSTCEAEATLHYLEELLASLRTETSSQTLSEKMSLAVNQKAVKIIAYRNGAGYRNGQLIIASTFPMVSNYHPRDNHNAVEKDKQQVSMTDIKTRTSNLHFPNRQNSEFVANNLFVANFRSDPKPVRVCQVRTSSLSF